MDKVINPVEFAQSVISGNPVAGDTPDEKAKNALNLYLACKKVIQEHNNKIKSETVVKTFKDSL